MTKPTEKQGDQHKTRTSTPPAQDHGPPGRKKPVLQSSRNISSPNPVWGLSAGVRICANMDTQTNCINTA